MSIHSISSSHHSHSPLHICTNHCFTPSISASIPCPLNIKASPTNWKLEARGASEVTRLARWKKMTKVGWDQIHLVPSLSRFGGDVSHMSHGMIASYILVTLPCASYVPAGNHWDSIQIVNSFVLHCVCSLLSSRQVAYLLTCSVLAVCVQDYLTPLHVAAHCGNVRTAKLLLDSKCQVSPCALVSTRRFHTAESESSRPAHDADRDMTIRTTVNAVFCRRLKTYLFSSSDYLSGA